MIEAKKRLHFMPLLTGILAACFLVSLAWAETIILEPAKDNTLYEREAGDLSNGEGLHFFAGRNGDGGGQIILRSLLAFDVASVIPAGSTIQSVQLTLNVSTPMDFTGAVTLHRVLQDWGEGASVAGQGEAGGGQTSDGDATWLHRFSPDRFWEAEGGDFVEAESASLDVQSAGIQIIESTPELVQDVQDWLDRTADSSGWLIRRVDEEQMAIRFDSRNNPTASARPMLTIDYVPPPIIISPATGLYHTTQTFDLVTLFNPGELTLMSRTILFDGEDATAAPGICSAIQQGMTESGLITIRCPDVTLAAGVHTLSVTLELGDGTNPPIMETGTVTWFVQETTEAQ